MFSSYILVLTISILVFSPTSNARKQNVNTIPCHFDKLAVELDNGETVHFDNVDLTIKYDNKNKAVYEYEGTPSVNFFVENSQVLLEGNSNRPDIPNKVVINSIIYGQANMQDNNKWIKTLKDCKSAIQRKNNPRSRTAQQFYNNILYIASECIESSLCESLGRINQNAFALAKKYPNRTFGPMDVRSTEISFFKNMTPPKPKNKSNVVDIIIKGIADIYKRQNGNIQLPNIGVIYLPKLKGTLSDLSQIRKSNEFPRASLDHENPKSVSFYFELNNAQINYEPHSKPLFFGSQHVRGSVENLKFKAEISMYFSLNVCKTSLTSLQLIKSSKPTFDGSNFFMTNQILNFLFNFYKNNIINSVRLNVENTIKDFLAEKNFDCQYKQSVAVEAVEEPEYPQARTLYFN